ncbi:MAG: hypothetical protein KJ906_00620 [Nanoarchaeota archaeon]|nr:hypothetical protein [Nanoarchaeota archaeon]
MKLPKLDKSEKIAIAFALIFLILVAIPVYRDKGDCEVARPGYECASAQEVMIENCNYWSKYNCDTSADNSLVQVEWYIDNLCDIHNRYNKNDVDCSNLKTACNQISGQSLC